MASRGMHFAIDPDTAAELVTAAGDDDRLLTLLEDIELETAVDACSTDQAWEAIHQVLSEDDILSLAVLGGRQLYPGADYLITYLNNTEVRSIAAAFQELDQSILRLRHLELELEDDFDYLWLNVAGLADFFKRIALSDVHVIFAVDQ